MFYMDLYILTVHQKMYRVNCKFSPTIKAPKNNRDISVSLSAYESRKYQREKNKFVVEKCPLKLIIFTKRSPSEKGNQFRDELLIKKLAGLKLFVSFDGECN